MVCHASASRTAVWLVTKGPSNQRCCRVVDRAWLQKIVNELAPPTLQTLWYGRTTRVRNDGFYFSNNNNNNNNKTFIWRLLQKTSERQIKTMLKRTIINATRKNNNIIPSNYNLNYEQEQLKEVKTKLERQERSQISYNTGNTGWKGKFLPTFWSDW